MELSVIDEERTQIVHDIQDLETRIALQRQLIRKLRRLKSRETERATDLLRMLLISLSRMERRRVALCGGADRETSEGGMHIESRASHSPNPGLEM